MPSRYVTLQINIPPGYGHQSMELARSLRLQGNSPVNLAKDSGHYSTPGHPSRAASRKAVWPLAPQGGACAGYSCLVWTAMDRGAAC